MLILKDKLEKLKERNFIDCEEFENKVNFYLKKY